jgi:Protein of unknown function (DUF4244)
MMFWRTAKQGRHSATRKREFWRWFRALTREDDGMSTAEYAIGTIAAAALAGLLYTIVTGDSVVAALTSLVQQALTVTF